MERVQVRVAALAERLGGFGTCAPGTWSPRASAYGHSWPGPHANRDGRKLGTAIGTPYESRPLTMTPVPRRRSIPGPGRLGRPDFSSGPRPMSPRGLPALGPASPGHTTTTHRRSPYYGAAGKPNLRRQPGVSGMTANLQPRCGAARGPSPCLSTAAAPAALGSYFIRISTAVAPAALGPWIMDHLGTRVIPPQVKASAGFLTATTTRSAA